MLVEEIYNKLNTFKIKKIGVAELSMEMFAFVLSAVFVFNKVFKKKVIICSSSWFINFVYTRVM